MTVTTPPPDHQDCLSLAQLSQQFHALQKQVSLLTSTLLHDGSQADTLLLAEHAAGPTAEEPQRPSPDPTPRRHSDPWILAPAGKRRGWESRLSPPPPMIIPEHNNRYKLLEDTDSAHPSPRAKKQRGPLSHYYTPNPRRSSSPPSDWDQIMEKTGHSALFPPLSPPPPTSAHNRPACAAAFPQTWPAHPKKKNSAPLQALPRQALLPTPPYPPPLLHARGRPAPRPQQSARAHGAAPLRSTSPTTNLLTPTVLVVGSSHVRHVSLPKAETCSFSGAKVMDINSHITNLTAARPQISTVIIHVGTNDIKFKQSEVLKEHFRTLITTTTATGKTCIISGPFPSPRHTDAQYSRILNLHIWLKGHCLEKGIPYTDNFTTLGTQHNLFSKDRLHLNWAGAGLLSFSMELTLKSLKPLVRYSDS